MKKVQMYQLDDGSLFKSLRSARARDKEMKAVQKLMKLLGGHIREEGCSFSNGEGYYEIDPKRVVDYDLGFVNLVEIYLPKLADQFHEKKIPISALNPYVGRYLSDSDTPLYGLVSLRMCIDKYNRRWGQPYFALNPNEGVQKKLGEFK